MGIYSSSDISRNFSIFKSPFPINAATYKTVSLPLKTQLKFVKHLFFSHLNLLNLLSSMLSALTITLLPLATTSWTIFNSYIFLWREHFWLTNRRIFCSFGRKDRKYYCLATTQRPFSLTQSLSLSLSHSLSFSFSLCLSLYSHR